MQFIKKLIILSGSSNAKGTLNLEKNAYGTFATINVFNLPDVLSGEYAVGIKTDSYVFTRNVGSMGRIMSKFKIDDIDLTKVHCVVYDTATESPMVYGTNDSKKLWEANLMDGIRSKKLEFKAKLAPQDIASALPDFTKREDEKSQSQVIDDYFFNIMPPNAEYADTAIAEVNYYPNQLKLEVNYSAPNHIDAIDSAENQNPIDRAIDKKENSIKLNPTEPVNFAPIHNDNFNNDNINSNISDIVPPNKMTEKYLKNLNLGTQKKSDMPIKGSLKSFEKSAEYKGNYENKIKNSFINNFKKSLKQDSVKVNTSDEKIKKNASININSQSDAAMTDREVASTVPPLSAFTPQKAIDNSKTESVFYEQIRQQIDDLFKTNPEFDLLQKLMPETKWVKVDYDGSGKYYVVGVVGSKPDYLCYGVPAMFSKDAPSELSGYCGWLPLDSENPQGEGFWLMFQDASTGESIDADFLNGG